MLELHAVSDGTRAARRGALSFPVCAALFTALAVLCDVLAVDCGLRAARVAEEPFRLFLAHFRHYNVSHAFGDVSAFFVWAALVEFRSRTLLAATVLVAAVATSCLVLLTPGVREYRGLSAVDAALAVQVFGMAVAQGFRDGSFLRAAVAASCLVAFAAKTAFEFHSGRAILLSDPGPAVRLLPAAHVVGAACGLCLLAIYAGASRGARSDMLRENAPKGLEHAGRPHLRGAVGTAGAGR